MDAFDFQLPTRIVFGAGQLVTLGDVAKQLGASRVLVASDPGVIAAGHTQRGIESLRAGGLAVELFDGVQENPTTKHVDAGLDVAKKFRPDLIVGLGGGSSMDCAKGINFLYSCGGRMQDYWGLGKATGPLLPMIAVPTTAGTGSETQSYALISDAETHVKMACGDKRAAFRGAILDPDLTFTQPPRVTALTGIDALSHAIETSVSKSRNPMSLMLSRAAWNHLVLGIRGVFAEPSERSYREAMQIGACFAGLAIENSMLGAAHALANPLTATYEIAHGQAIAIMLPHVIRRNAAVVAEDYEQLFSRVEPRLSANSGDSSRHLAEFVTEVTRLGGLATKLSECNVRYKELPKLAGEAAKQWTGKFNPVELTTDDYLKLYEAAF